MIVLKGLEGLGFRNQGQDVRDLDFSFGLLVLVCALLLRFGSSGVGGGVEGRGGWVLHLGLKGFRV